MSVPIPSEAIAVGVGAVCGALTRYQCGRLAGEWIASDPNRLGALTGWHTALINVSGSFVLGGVAAAPSIDGTKSKMNVFGLSPRARLFLGVGFCGSFTTFSTYSVDVATWLSQGKMVKAVSYIMVNNVGAAAAAAGMVFVRKIFGGY